MKDQVRLTPQQREFLEERGLSAAFMKEVAQRRGQDKKPLHKVAFAEGGMNTNDPVLANIAQQNEMIKRLASGNQGQALASRSANPAGQNTVGYTNMEDMNRDINAWRKETLEAYNQAGIDPNQTFLAALEARNQPFDTTYGGASTADNQLKSGQAAAIPGVDPGDGTVFYPPPVYGGPVEEVQPTPVQPQYDYSVTRPYLQTDPTSPDYSPEQALIGGGTSFDPQAYNNYITQKYDFEGLQSAVQEEEKQNLLNAFTFYGESPIDEQGNVRDITLTRDLTDEAKQSLKSLDLSDPDAIRTFIAGPGAFANPDRGSQVAEAIIGMGKGSDPEYVKQYDVDGSGEVTAADVQLIRTGQRQARSDVSMLLEKNLQNMQSVKSIQAADQEARQEMQNNPEYQNYIQLQNQRQQMTAGAQNLATGAMSDRASLVAQQQVATLDPYTQGTTIAPTTGQVGEMDTISAATGTAETSDVPTAGTATTYSATSATDAMRTELGGVGPAQGTMSTGAQVQAQTGTLSAEAKADAATMDPNRVQQVVSGDRVIDSTELAQAQGLDEEAIAADIANANKPENIKAAQTSVQLNEIPDAATIAEGDMAQAQGMTDAGLVPDAKATIDKLKKFSVDDQTLAEFKAGSIDARDTVTGQLKEVFNAFKNDNEIPDFAKAAVGAVNAQMAARGLGGSSIAAAAITDAILQAAIPLAQSDAEAFRNMKMDNLGRQQQVSLANAAAQQGVDLANLNSEQVLALQNSQNAFSLQSQNLSNMQSTMLSNAQLKAGLQGQNLSNQQQANIVAAARYAEVNNLNLSNTQQGLMQDNMNDLQVNLANLSSNQQAYIANANLEAALQGKRIDNKQQAAIVNAAKYFEAGNTSFSAKQQAALHNSNLMSTIGLAELNTQQQAVLQNATAVASMDMANLTNRQQAAVENAKAFLNLDLTNLSNDQQTSLFKAQSMVQSIFTDQAADNAAKQFNASSENQVDQFFSNLISTVNMANTAQSNSMSQFNAGQENTITSLVANIENMRDQFNAGNSLVIAQGNANWRQNVATINTAAENEAYAQFAKDLNALTDGAIDEIWQRERDIMSFSFDLAENAKDRTLNLLLADKNLESVREQIAAGENAAETEMFFTLGLELLKGW